MDPINRIQVVRLVQQALNPMSNLLYGFFKQGPFFFNVAEDVLNSTAPKIYPKIS